jgi:hypothetical protein
MQSACVILSSVACPDYLINDTIFGNKKLLNICVFWFSLQLLSEIFLSLRRNERDMIISVYWSSCKMSVILAKFKRNLNFIDRFSRYMQISNFTKIHSVGAELFHVDVHSDRHDDPVTIRNFAKASIKHYTLPKINGIKKRLFCSVCYEQNFTKLWLSYVVFLTSLGMLNLRGVTCSLLYQLSGKVSFCSSTAWDIVF